MAGIHAMGDNGEKGEIEIGVNRRKELCNSRGRKGYGRGEI